ncbi:MAG: (2Fe-2S)-binding protein [Bacillota bacterium]
MVKNTEFTLNGKAVSLDIEPSKRFLDVLRNDLNLKGPKEGCGEGECGACAVLIDGNIVNTCILPLANVEGKTVTTIEGFSKTQKYEVIKEAFKDEGGVQCGFCTPGMIIATESLLNKNPNPSDDAIRIGLSGNLCRCTGYELIIKAVKLAAKRGEGLW